MSLTFGQAKDILAQFQGKGGKRPSDAKLNEFVLKVLDYLLISGSPDSEQAFELYAYNGYITAPYELQTPLKVSVNGRVGQVVSKWFEFRSGNDFNRLKGCADAADTLHEEANTFYTAYDIPCGGAHVGIMGTADECEDAHIIIQGNDATGREIFTQHKGVQIAGELLTIKKNQITWSNVVFDTIVGIVKTKTVGYTPLYWRTPLGVKGFLSDYSPVEEVPSYRRFRLSIPNCPSPAKITVLGRVRLKEKYTDNDRIPFSSRYTLEIAGKQVSDRYNDKNQSAMENDRFLGELVEREATFKKPNTGSPLEVFHATSAGTIQGIVGRR